MNGLTLRISGCGSKKTKNSFSFPTVILPESNVIKNLASRNTEVQQFLRASNVEQQLTILKKILSTKDTLLDEDLIRFLVLVFLQAEVKHPVKCFLTRSITKSDFLHQPFSGALSEAILLLISDPHTSYQSYVEVVSRVLTCVENFPAGSAAVKDVEIPLAQYLMSGLKCAVRMLNETKCLSPTEKNEVFNLAHSILRLILYITQKVSPEHVETLNSLFLEIRVCFKNLLYDDDVPMDTKSVCGIVFVSMYIMQNNSDSWVNILDNNIKDEMLQSFLESDASRLSVYSAIATVVPPHKLQAHIVHDSPALVLLTTSIIEVGDRTCSDSTFNLAVARTLAQISKGLHRLDKTVGSRLVDVLLPYVWAHLDHHMDSVRHLSGQALASVVSYCKRMQEEGDSSALDELFASLSALDRHRKSYYVSLAALTSSLGASDVITRLPTVIRDVMECLHIQAVQASATTALETLLRAQSHVSARALYEQWVVGAARAGGGASPALEGLLAAVVRMDAGVIDYILQHIERERDSPSCNLSTVLMLVGVGRRAGAWGAHWMTLVGRGALRAAAVSAVDQTRIQSLSLVVECPKTTEVFAEEELELVLYFLRYNMNARAPNFRQLMLSLIKKFLKRLEDSYKVLERRRGAGGYYERFLDNLRALCFASLLPGASYGRRTAALQLLAWAETCLRGHKRAWKEEYVEKLLLHLEDSYENNKALSLEILHHCPLHLLQDKMYSISLDIADIFAQAESVKPTDCVSAAYKLSLLQDKLPQSILEGQEYDIPEPVTYALLGRLLGALRAGLAACAGSVVEAAARRPMYPLLHCMCRLVRTCGRGTEGGRDSISSSSAWRALVSDIVSTCREVTATVACVVNNSSPEGHLPMDRGGVEVTDHGNSGDMRLPDGRLVTAQMVLLCAWRSVKEVSLLLGALVSRLELGPDGLLTFSQVAAIGDHFTSLLAETKHRGAFEQAYVGFTMLLARLWRHRSPELHELPRKWLDELMSAIQSPGQSKLCATRRSAGLPFMIQALVTTELQVRSNPVSFDACMCTLLRVARTGDVTARTHARNVVRALVRAAALAAVALPWLGGAVRVAVDGFEGDTWQERNSSTLLFSALMVRIFGVQRAGGGAGGAGGGAGRDRMTGRVFFLRYPELYDYMLNKLEQASAGDRGGRGGGALYPVLLLLGRLYPSALEGTVSNLKLVSFIPHVVGCARSGDLRARRLAAAAARPLLDPNRYMSHLESLLDLLSDKTIERNHCHGLLLQITRLLEYKPGEVCVSGGARGAEGVQAGVRRALWTLRQPCYVIADECLNMVSLVISRFDTILEREDIDNIVDALNILLFDNTDPLHAPGRAVCLANCAYLCFIILNLYSSGDLCRIVYKCLSHTCYEVVLSALNYILIMHNELEIEDNFQDHLAKVSKKSVLDELNTSKYLELLCDIIKSNKYLECNQKALKVLTLNGDTQSYIIRAKEGNVELTEDIIIEKLFYYIENEHENLIHIYLHSLCQFLSKMLRSADVNGKKMLEAIRVIFACSSSDNSEATRKVIVDFLDDNIELLLALDLKHLQDGEKFEYRATVYCTLVTLLEDDELSLSQRSSSLVWRAVGGDVISCHNTEPAGDVISSHNTEPAGDVITSQCAEREASDVVISSRCAERGEGGSGDVISARGTRRAGGEGGDIINSQCAGSASDDVISSRCAERGEGGSGDVISSQCAGEGSSDVINSHSTERGGDVISSRCAEQLRRYIAAGDVETAVGCLATVALQDFKSEVVMTEEGSDECRVFDTNEKYNINLEEGVWTRGCAEEIRTICEGHKDLVQYVRDILAQSVYRTTVENLCGNNYVLFSNPQCEVSVVNPKVHLFIDDLTNS